ncbi:MAG: heme-binding protein [Polyangiaceae bacterium]|nr:heme-binding protein [Polyangiaceae bacterium]
MGLATSLFNVATGFQLMRRTVEAARYVVLAKYPTFEVRRYAAHVVAETEIEAPLEEGERTAFRRLAAYIFAKNRRGAPIAMTTPVKRRAAGRESALPTPVIESLRGERRVMEFTLPGGRAVEEFPAPSDPAVVLRRVPPQTLAALRFSGRAKEDEFEHLARTLWSAVATHGYRGLGPAILAQYDPPWVFGPFRRNEVLLEVEKA